MAKKYVAYLKDGTLIRFKHSVDRQEGIAHGLLPNPPGQPVPIKKAEPEGEKVTGIEPLTKPAAESGGKAVEEESKGKKVNRIPRQ